MRGHTFIFVCLLAAIPCSARIITVDDDGPADFNNIQAAINNANNGDTIIVPEGTYFENINFNGKNIILRSTEPDDPNVVANTIIDGSDVNSVVVFSGTENSNCVLSGFTITNGSAHSGGGIDGNCTMATIQKNIIHDNEAIGGDMPGAYGYGGGLVCCNGVIQYNTISNNSAMIAGGLSCDGIIQYNNITHNDAGYLGGGLGVCDGIIQHNIISQNSAAHGGGLAYCSNIISNNIISYNSNYGNGGGLHRCNDIIRNNTIFGNSANYGGGLGKCNGTIVNCIIWQNTSQNQGAQLYESSTPSYSCVQGWTDGGFGNIDENPLLADSNNGDYHLKSQAGRWHPNSQSWVQDAVTSPCIDAGDHNSDWTAELWPHGKRINMGAYGGTPEASMSLSDAGNIADLNNDGSVDYLDVILFTDKWPYHEILLPEDLDRNGFVDFIDFAIFSYNWRWEQ